MCTSTLHFAKMIILEGICTLNIDSILVIYIASNTNGVNFDTPVFAVFIFWLSSASLASKSQTFNCGEMIDVLLGKWLSSFEPMYMFVTPTLLLKANSMQTDNAWQTANTVGCFLLVKQVNYYQLSCITSDFSCIQKYNLWKINLSVLLTKIIVTM